MVKYSVVVPIYNEEDTLPELYRRLEAVMRGLGEKHEVIFVNDGSQDRSLQILKTYAAKNPSVKIVDLSRNFGLQPAYSAGIDHAQGQAVIPMDGDLQDPPELIPRMIEKLNEGYDVVYTVKTKRQEGFLKRFAFSAFYRILRKTSNVDMPLDAGSFSIMNRKVADIFKSLPEKNRLVSGIRAWVGFRQTGIHYERDARYSGPPRQTFFRLMRMATDGLFSFSTVPIRIATFLGLFASGLALLAIVVVLYLKIFTDVIPVSGWASTMIAVMFFGGIQLVFIGVLGEYVCRIFDEVKDRPLYLVKETVGFRK
ncbi:MAG: glycosyltransferase [Elusimicrobia bacterium RIFCSPLOWO2_01_FULL_60_11]|nr:MAG: glycosyltransferase [Elusimicrobia bacterium RIFCSPLOWO2_01_FULL_60_11]